MYSRVRPVGQSPELQMGNGETMRNVVVVFIIITDYCACTLLLYSTATKLPPPLSSRSGNAILCLTLAPSA